jgi:hypothetical protein
MQESAVAAKVKSFGERHALLTDLANVEVHLLQLNKAAFVSWPSRTSSPSRRPRPTKSVTSMAGTMNIAATAIRSYEAVEG